MDNLIWWARCGTSGVPWNTGQAFSGFSPRLSHQTYLRNIHQTCSNAGNDAGYHGRTKSSFTSVVKFWAWIATWTNYFCQTTSLRYWSEEPACWQLQTVFQGASRQDLVENHCEQDGSQPLQVDISHTRTWSLADYDQDAFFQSRREDTSARCGNCNIDYSVDVLHDAQNDAGSTFRMLSLFQYMCHQAHSGKLGLLGVAMYHDLLVLGHATKQHAGEGYRSHIVLPVTDTPYALLIMEVAAFHGPDCCVSLFTLLEEAHVCEPACREVVCEVACEYVLPCAQAGPKLLSPETAIPSTKHQQ